MTGHETGPPVLPYGGDTHPNSGHSGSDTSQARAESGDASGTTSERQRRVLAIADSRQWIGVTVSELRSLTGWHHGQASSALSTLHASGALARLTIARGRCKVYVLPSAVQGRETETQGQSATTLMLAKAVEVLKAAGYDRCHRHSPYFDFDCNHCAGSAVVSQYEAGKGKKP